MLFLYGDYHQGSPVFHDESRGRQCMPNSIIFSALSQIRPIATWSSDTLKVILHSGDVLYTYIRQECLVSSDFLFFEDLPKHFTFLGKNFSIKNEKSFSGTLTKKIYYVNDFLMSLEFAFNLVFYTGQSKFGAILIFCDSALSVIRIQNEFYVFDPHSRCRDGLLSSEGACHVSKFTTLVDLCSFLRDLAVSLSKKKIRRNSVQYAWF